MHSRSPSALGHPTTPAQKQFQQKVAEEKKKRSGYMFEQEKPSRLMLAGWDTPLTSGAPSSSSSSSLPNALSKRFELRELKERLTQLLKSNPKFVQEYNEHMGLKDDNTGVLVPEFMQAEAEIFYLKHAEPAFADEYKPKPREPTKREKLLQLAAQKRRRREIRAIESWRKQDHRKRQFAMVEAAMKVQAQAEAQLRA